MITLHIHQGNDTSSHDDGVRTITFPNWEEFKIDHIGRSRIHAITVSEQERIDVRHLFHVSFTMDTAFVEPVMEIPLNRKAITYTDHNLNHILNNLEYLKA